VTNEEVLHGILESYDRGGDSLACFIRIFDDLNEHLEDGKARDYIDLPWGGSGPDVEAQELLSTLRDEKVPSCLPSDRLLPYRLRWTPKGVDPENPEHKEYLESFSSTFYSTITEMVDRAAEEERQLRSKLKAHPILEEILTHLSFCRDRCEIFQGREETLKTIQRHIEKKEEVPLILYGESGCGKTSIMAKAAQQARKLFGNEEGAVVVRFLGTTADSSNLHKLLRSLSIQICLLYGRDAEEVPEEHRDLLDFFTNRALMLATSEKPLVLLLDSLDQLSPSYGAYLMGWIPKTLPPHVSLIISTLPRERNCLPKLRQRLAGVEATFLEVPILPSKVGIDIVESWLLKEGRRLTQEQRGVVEKALEKCSLPLYLRLVFNEAKRWTSYTPLSSINLPPSIHEMIEQLFERIEKQHGKLLVSHAFGFISASRNGLSETELEDLLSLDDAVLEDIFQYWLPPVRRLPPLLWTRVRADIEDYLAERDGDGSLVIYWFHRQFIEVAIRRYLAGKGGEVWGEEIEEKNLSPEEKEDLAPKLHLLLSEYFQGIWAEGRKKPFRYTPRQVKFFGLKDSQGEEDRRVSSQPLIYSGFFLLPFFSLPSLPLPLPPLFVSTN